MTETVIICPRMEAATWLVDRHSRRSRVEHRGAVRMEPDDSTVRVLRLRGAMAPGDAERAHGRGQRRRHGNRCRCAACLRHGPGPIPTCGRGYRRVVGATFGRHFPAITLGASPG